MSDSPLVVVNAFRASWFGIVPTPPGEVESTVAGGSLTLTARDGDAFFTILAQNSFTLAGKTIQQLRDEIDGTGGWTPGEVLSGSGPKPASSLIEESRFGGTGVPNGPILRALV